jgi:hypothetical protein
MAWRATLSAALLVAAHATTGMARSSEEQPSTSALADSSGATSAPQTTAVAAFPDLPPERPTPPVDPALALLASDPYETALTAIKIARNLYGGDPLFDNPYSGALRLANPYSDAWGVAAPSTNALVTDGYGNALLEDPYR